MTGTKGLTAFILMITAAAGMAQTVDLAPAVAVEAEHFTIDRGWEVTKMGEGNYAVDIIGFIHAGGERFLSARKDDTTASAYTDITVPQAGAYHLWVRYEYMPFTETRFEVSVEQDGQTVASGIIGAKDNLRIAFQQQELTIAQYDPPWGNEGLVEERLIIPNLEAGPARLRLETVPQPQIPGLTANRHVDLLYLSSDTEDSWRQQYNIQFYRILDAFRDTLGARYEVRFTNRGQAPMQINTSHYYNRQRFYGHQDPEGSVQGLPPGDSTDWLPMPRQDTTHFGQASFQPRPTQPFTVEIRPLGGGTIEETVESEGETVRIYLPTYPGQGETAINVLTSLDRVLQALEERPAPGRTPTAPLNYGWTMPYGAATEYARRYARLWAKLGMRTYRSIPDDDTAEFLAELGVPPNRSLMAMLYRNPPTPENIAAAKKQFEDAGKLHLMRRFDYGDEIPFSEWVGRLIAQMRIDLEKPGIPTEDLLRPLWQAWLDEHRAGYDPRDYWRDAWGEMAIDNLRPDSSADAAKQKPVLYVDSIIFYEDSAIAYVAAGARQVRAELGEHVLTGANYSGYPFYIPSTTMYVKWFRDGAADFGRHSEYFWQLGQVTPMVNGLFAEYFRSGLRFNPEGRMIQYNMPHSPGNTDASFRRSAFSHLAHGVTMFDYFGIGMNETFTENYIDHRDVDRYVAIRDINYAMGLVDDVLEAARPVASPVALLASESTERWDRARVALDYARAAYAGPDFRQTRLTYYQDRLGIYKALCFGGVSPDIVIERDVLDGLLDEYKVLFAVGDSLSAGIVPVLESWIRDGGVLFATAAAGRFDAYRQPNPDFDALLGLEERNVTEHDRFMRPSQEIPFLEPIGRINMSLDQEQNGFAALAIEERFVIDEANPDVRVLARFDDQSPAVIERQMGQGRIIYAATLPGLAYLYTGLTTPRIEVPDRGPAAHRAVNTYDTAAAALILHAVRAANVTPPIRSSRSYIDARLVASDNGRVFMVPMANYHAETGHDVTLTVRPPSGAAMPIRAESAFAGEIGISADDQGDWVFTVPSLGYGDMIRIDLD